MAKPKEEKNNVMRILDAEGVQYSHVIYDQDPKMTGEDIAHLLGQDPESVFKTLVTRGKSGQYYVFMVPVCSGLDLKKAAMSVGEKNVEMIKSKELLPLTGYVHGGCSPIGMKKQFITTIDETSALFEKIYCSGGRLGCQICIAPGDLERVIDIRTADITA